MQAVLRWFSWVLLSLCVLLGAEALSTWSIGPQWVQLAVAAIVGFAAGAVAPQRVSAWLAWVVLVVFAWAFYVWAAIYMMAAPMRPLFVVYPLAASVGVVAGLIFRRMPVSLVVWRLAPIVLGAAAIVGILFLKAPRTALGNPGRWQPPAFTLQLPNGGQVSSGSLTGKTIVLSFWATWCEPCLEELPALQRLYATRYAGQKDVRFFLVNEDTGSDAAAKASAWLARQHVSMPSALDPNGTLAATMKASVMPTRVVIDRHNWVVLTKFGYDQKDARFSGLRAAIAESRQ